jgi:hypothetical protein
MEIQSASSLRDLLYYSAQLKDLMRHSCLRKKMTKPEEECLTKKTQRHITSFLATE